MNENEFIDILNVDRFRYSNNGCLNDVTQQISIDTWPSSEGNRNHMDYIALCNIYIIDYQMFIPKGTKFRRYRTFDRIPGGLFWVTSRIEIYYDR